MSLSIFPWNCYLDRADEVVRGVALSRVSATAVQFKDASGQVKLVKEERLLTSHDLSLPEKGMDTLMLILSHAEQGYAWGLKDSKLPATSRKPTPTEQRALAALVKRRLVTEHQGRYVGTDRGQQIARVWKTLNRRSA